MLFAQEQKDSLFFDYNKEYFFVKKNDPNSLYLNIAKYAGEGSVFFYIKNTYHNLAPKKTLDLKKFIQTTQYYNKKSNEIRSYNDLADFLYRYHLFFTVTEKNGEKKYIEVGVGVIMI